MGSLLVVAQVVVLGGMVAVSTWGWKHIGAGTRVRQRGDDVTGIDWTMNKPTMLVLTPLIGLVVVIMTLTFDEASGRDTVAGVGVAGMVIFLWAHWATVKRAAR